MLSWRHCSVTSVEVPVIFCAGSQNLTLLNSFLRGKNAKLYPDCGYADIIGGPFRQVSDFIYTHNKKSLSLCACVCIYIYIKKNLNSIFIQTLHINRKL